MEPGTLSELDIPSEIIDIVPADIARKYQIVPLERKGPFLVIGVLDPTDTPLIDELKVVLGENFLMPTQNAQSYAGSTRRIKKQLKAEGIVASRQRIRRKMAAQGLVAKARRKHVPPRIQTTATR